MFVKSDIRKITVAVEKDRASDAYLALGRAGIVHLSRYAGKDAPSSNVSTTEESLVRDIVAATDTVLHALQVAPQGTYLREKPLEPHSDAILATGYRKNGRTRRPGAGPFTKRDGKYSPANYLSEVLGSMGADAGILKNASFLNVIFGTVEDVAWETPIEGRFDWCGQGIMSWVLRSLRMILRCSIF
jgi:hypothetical protein